MRARDWLLELRERVVVCLVECWHRPSEKGFRRPCHAYDYALFLTKLIVPTFCAGARLAFGVA